MSDYIYAVTVLLSTMGLIMLGFATTYGAMRVVDWLIERYL